jgi:DegV family protein with EDD domain
VIPVGKTLSSTHDVILNQSKKYKNKLISVIDTGLNSAPLGLLVTYASLLAESGHSHAEIIVKLEAAKSQSNVLVLLNSLDGMIRSGRLSKSMGFLAKLLRLKPIIHLDENGRPKVIGAALTKRSGWRKLIKHVNELYEAGKIKSLAIVHSDTQARGAAFGKYIQKNTGLTPAYITGVSCVSAIHTDKNSFAIGYINQKINV